VVLVRLGHPQPAVAAPVVQLVGPGCQGVLSGGGPHHLGTKPWRPVTFYVEDIPKLSQCAHASSRCSDHHTNCRSTAPGVNLVMVPLEVTHTALATPEVLGQLLTSRQPITPFKLLMQQLLTFFADTYRQVFAFQDPPLHDPCAVAYVIDPSLFQVGRKGGMGGRGSGWGR